MSWNASPGSSPKLPFRKPGANPSRQTTASPLRITGVETDYSADELGGQLKIRCEYGVLRGRVKTVPINRPEIVRDNKLQRFDKYMTRGVYGNREAKEAERCTR